MVSSIDFSNDKIVFEDRTYNRPIIKELKFSEYIKSEIIKIEGLDFLCVQSINYTFFFCDKIKEYKELLRIFAEKPSVLQSLLAKHQNDFSSIHILLGSLLNATLYEFGFNRFSGHERYGIRHDSEYLSYNNIEFVDSIIKVKEMCDSILPERIEDTKKKALKEDVKGIIRFYCNYFGNDFEKLNEDDENIVKNILKMGENIVDVKTCLEIDYYKVKYAISINVIDALWVTRLERFHNVVMPMVDDILRKEESEYLIRRYGDLNDLKDNLIKSIGKMAFADSLELYRHYQKVYDVILAENRERKIFEVNAGLWEEYKIYYYYGKIMISDHMNKINKHKGKNKSIPRDELDKAMIYFYDTSQAEEAYEKKKNIDYKENKVAGNEGEKIVNYALRWLDKEYVQIEARSVDRVGTPCIIIYNPGFVDEPQEYDHIVVSPKGIFVIETKNYRGKIIIDEAHNWIRETDGERVGVTNPLQQIRQHEKLLKSILPVEMPIISIVCIANNQAIIEGADNSEVPIVKADRLVEYIETYNSDKQAKLLIEDYRKCTEIIYKYMK